ncbi:MAG: hypothetical protein J6W52_12130 [Bacteroidaceae bacterium]|nr:hypothetical protein [Bacteroidaceae bacterium]
MTIRKDEKVKGENLKVLMNVIKIRAFIKSKMPKEFSAHQFITKLMEKETELYGKLLCKYKNATITQMVIGKYLQNYQKQLGIKQGNKGNPVPSTNILQKPSKCAIWIQTKK